MRQTEAMIRIAILLLFLVIATSTLHCQSCQVPKETIHISTVAGTPEAQLVKDKIELYKLLNDILLDDSKGIVDIQKQKQFKGLLEKIQKQMKGKYDSRSPK